MPVSEARFDFVLLLLSYESYASQARINFLSLVSLYEHNASQAYSYELIMSLNFASPL